MVLVMIDRFSKWAEIVPLRKATTEAEALKSSSGSSACATAPYTPQQNPTERANRTVKTMFAQFAGKDQRAWDEHWPELMLAVNSAVSESTGYSPCFVTQGREPRMPQALFDENALGTGAGQGTPTENATRLKEVFEIVLRNMERAAQDPRRKWSPKVGETVWAKKHHLSKAAEGFTAKLAPQYDGPFTVVDFVSPVIAILRNGGTNKEKRAHVSELKCQDVEDAKA
nr:uncharacterized protein LOC122322172 [Drosophila bipectinata]